MLSILVLTVFTINNNNCKDFDFGQNFEIHKGVNLSHWLSQTEIRGKEREEYVTEKDIIKIAEMGFDHIRLPIDEVQMWDENGKKHKEAFQLLHNAIDWCRKNGLRVIVDLHVIRAHHFNDPNNRQIWEDITAQENFIKLWYELSAELNSYPNNFLAYEPLNEAVSENSEDWNNLINKIIFEIRKLEKDRTIIMGSNMWQKVETFKDLKIPKNNENIILSFHYYTPFLFTHYKAPWTPLKDFDGKINYPAWTADTSIYSEMNSDLVKEMKIHNKYYDLAILEADILQAVEVAKKNNMKLYCGEFGCFPTTPIEMRVKWYEDMNSIFQKHDIAWAHWNYKNDFPLVDENLNPITEIVNTMNLLSK